MLKQLKLTRNQGFMVAWSVVTILSYKARNYTDMLVCRFFLGLVEAPVSTIVFQIRALSTD